MIRNHLHWAILACFTTATCTTISASADELSNLKEEIASQKQRMEELELRLLRVTAQQEKTSIDAKKAADSNKSGIPAGMSIYGIADAGVEYGDYGKGEKLRVQSGLGSASRLGFKGERKFNDNMSAYFLLEAGIALDDGQNTAHSSNISNPGGGSLSSTGQTSTGVAVFSRQTYVGLKGKDWGDVRFGRDYIPLYNAVVSPADPFTIGGATAYRLVSGSTAGRFDNAIQYISPTIAGFEGRLMYSAGMENNTDKNIGITKSGGSTGGNDGLGPKEEGKGWSASVTYKNGNLFVGGGYLDFYRTGGVTGTAEENIKRKAFSLGLTYDFSVAKVYGLFVNGKDRQSGVVVVDTVSTAAGKTLNNNIYWLGVSVPFLDSHTFRAVYAVLDEKLARNRDSTHIGLGYEYAFDKQTDVYAHWASVTNKNGGGNTLLAGGHGQGFGRPADMPASEDFNPSALMLGVRYRF